MDKYTIYCTEAQAKKALELGAPIETFGYGYLTEINKKILNNKHFIIEKDDENCSFVIYLPTAEQMIGWINDQGLLVVIGKNYSDYCWQVWENSCIIDMSETETIKTLKEATLSAIDAALDYLKNNRK